MSCHIRTLTIPKSIKSIGSGAFTNCPLENVYYEGNKKDWDNIYFENPGNTGEYYGRTGLHNANNIHYGSVHKNDADNIAAHVEADLNSVITAVPICDDVIYGPPVNILGKDYYPLKFDAKAVLNLAGLDKIITVDEDNKTVHVILGKKTADGSASVVQTTKTCDASWSKQYNEIKDLYKTMTGLDAKGSSGGVSNWNRFEKMKAELNRLQADFIISADMSVAAYMEFDYQTGKLKLSEGGIIETASLGAELKQGTLLYVSLGLKGSEEGTIKATLSSEGIIEPYMSIKPSLTATAKIGGGIKTLNLEGGVNATLAVLLQTSEPNLKVSMDGKIFVEGTVGSKIYDLWNKQYLDCELYPEFKDNLSSNSLSAASVYSLRAASAAAAESVADDDGWEDMDRSYLYAPAANALLGEENVIYKADNVYPNNDARLVRLTGDSMMLVWNGDDGTKSDINRSSLMYSVYKNGSWSDTAAINEDGTATLDFRIAQDGDNIYIVYQKLNKVLDDDTSLEDMLKQTDLYYTKYSGGGFSEPTRITSDNEIYETIGDVNVLNGALKTAWVENSENALLMDSGTNYIKTYIEGGEIETAVEADASDESCIDGICIDDGGLYYTVADSVEDTSVLYKYDGEISSVLESNAVISNLTSFGGGLYYLKNAAVYTIDNGVETEVGVDGITDFKLVTNGSETSMIASVFDGSGSELYISRYENGAWTHKERFTDLGKYIRSYSPFMYDDGTVNAAEAHAPSGRCRAI